ncbi:MAG: type II secretion system F family protein [Lachnospiraceae bacterium]|nr:type II secretion system F family protein [Ruminococcus sp.]MBO4921969.1 type II secretion system F family protein [Lachnospiraceae bacterium]MBR4145897.1 type II secretion system F family protein [Lachnospiraceae bacterium]MBR6474302.1 type II secretion system F family protein [Lachnospiraceae bacterium]
MPDYDEFTFTRSELLKNILIPSGMIVFLALLCYNNIFFAVLLLPYIPYHLAVTRKKLKEGRKWKLNMQFRDCINCISSALESGYSIENALKEAYTDMKLSYAEEDLIMVEMKGIISAVGNNRTVEDVFLDFSNRSGVDDIKSFADIFATAKRTGGNLILIIKSTADVIHTRVELKRELRTVIASKKYEADIMKLIPFGILIYLRVFSPDMVAALYGNLFGIAFMTVILVLYLLLCRISDHVVKIEL